MEPVIRGPLQQISDHLAIEILGRLVIHARIDKALKNQSGAEIEAWLAKALLEIFTRHDQSSVAGAVAKHLVEGIDLEREFEELRRRPKEDGKLARPSLDAAKSVVRAILEPLKAAAGEGSRPSRLSIIESHMHLIRRGVDMSGYRGLPTDDVDAAYLVERWVKDWWPMRPGRPKKTQ